MLDLTRPDDPPRTPLAEVAAALGTPIVGADDQDDGTGVLVTGVTLSTDRVRPGDLYAALPGSRTHGAAYAGLAREAGAVAVLTDEAGRAESLATGLPALVVPRPREVLGALAARIYGDPADGLVLMAVTGTQGKTTTTRLLEGALQAAGVPAAVVGTLGTRMLGQGVPTALTTPEAPDLQALFAVMRERGVRACAMEVSSHALVLGRVDGTVFDAAAFVNLGRDHLDFHADLEDYFAAKATLFAEARSRRGLTNVDDEHGRRLLEVARVPMATFSAAGAPADWRAVDVAMEADGSRFAVLTPEGERLSARVPLPGVFNVTNALCAIALAAEAGLDPAAVAAGLADAGGVPGRLERTEAGQPFLAIVDYAHKPDALAAVLAALRPVTRGRLLLVVGAGGDRDAGKRPLMGEVGARLADVLVVTDDNPRSEDPARIRAEVLAGVGDGAAEVVEIGDRREAIRYAVSLARPGDTVLVAGKGHETGQEVGAGAGRVVHAFDDRDEVRAAIEAWTGRP